MDRLQAALSDTPVVVLIGARQTGKSTLAQELIRAGHPAAYVTLDVAGVRAAAHSDPEGFIAAYTSPVVIDEVQLAPALFPAIKESVDRDRRAGRFLLTGSANVLLLPKISESLAGRTEVITLWPLSQGELAGRKERFIDVLFGPRVPQLSEAADLRRDVLRRALRGGYPEAIARDAPSRRAAWFDSYVDTILQRDVRQISNIEGLAEMPRLLTLLAARAASVLNVAELSRAVGMRDMTVRRYLTLLERIFFVQRTPAWSGNLGTRVIRHPKVTLVDSGLLAHLQGIELSRFESDATLAGALLENFVVAELRKQLGWSEVRAGLYHFRARRGEEVDVVLELRDGRLAGVEVKARSSVDAADFKGLRALAEATGKNFQRGVVLYAGKQTVAFAKNLYAVPLSAVWKL